MKEVKFKTPNPIKKTGETFNQVVATGVVAKYQDKNGVKNFLDEYEKKGAGTTYYMFLMSLKVNGSNFKVRALNSEKFPTRTKDFAEKVEEDLTVTVTGSFSESFNMETNRTYRETMAWKLEPVNSTAEHKIAVTLQGQVGAIQKADGGLNLTVVIPSTNPTYDDQKFQIFASNENPYTKWILENNVAPQDYIRVNAYYRNEIERDDFGNIMDSINITELYSVSNYQKNLEANAAINMEDLPF